MTGSSLKTLTESILDDSVDDVLFYQLLNIAKDTIEEERPWMFLRAVDSTQTAPTGGAYTTSIPLPTAWRNTYKLYVGLDNQYVQVPFDEQHVHRFSSNRFVVDVANSVYYLLGTIGQADTIYHYYIKSTPDITSATSPVMPERFHGILAFMVAGYIMMGIDADDIFARMSPENKVMAQTIKASMIAWDMKLQMQAQNNQVQVADTIIGLPLGMM